MNVPFGANPPTSVRLAQNIDYTNKTGTLNQMIDKLNEWMIEFNAPFPQIERLNPTGGSRRGSWTNEFNKVIVASNKFYDWGYGGKTIPLLTFVDVGFNAFTSALDKIVSYWAIPFANGGVKPMPFQEINLGVAKGVNFHKVGDIPITINVAKYSITIGITVNNIGGTDPFSYQGSLMTGPNGTGDDLGIFLYCQDSTMGYWAASPGPLDILTQPTLYYNIQSADDTNATGDIYLMGYDLTGV